MAGVNRVILIGNLGKDPEIRNLEGGAKVANFSLATTEVFKNRNGEKSEHTEWHNIVLWRGLAEVAEKYLRKGNPVYIEGRIRSRSWDDKDGNKRYTTEIVADNLQMLGGRKDSGDNGGTAYAQKQEETSAADPSDIDTSVDDDLPF